MSFGPETVIRNIILGCILAFKFFLLVLLPFSELVRRMLVRSKEDGKISARLDSFERNVTALLVTKVNSKSTDNKTSNDPITTHTNTDTTKTKANMSSASTSDSSNIASTSSTQSSSASSSINKASSGAKQPPSSALINDINHLRVQSNESFSALSDEIDDLQEINKAMKAQVATLEAQLQARESQTSQTRNRLANRLDILEGYFQNVKDKKAQENQEIHLLSQRNNDLINQRVDALEEQLIASFKAFDERRNKELLSFLSNSKSLSKTCDEIKMQLDKQAKMTALHEQEVAKNTETIRKTFSSQALTGLREGVADALNLCERQLGEMEKKNEKTQALLEGTRDKLKAALNAVVVMKAKVKDTKEDVTVQMLDVSGRFGWVSQKVLKTAERLNFDTDRLSAPTYNPVKKAKENDEDETF